MGKSRGRQPRRSAAFEPRGNEPFNIIMSLQYRGWKEQAFPSLAFSSIEGTKRAMNTLQLTTDLDRLGLPGFVSPDRVCRSSYGYPNTIEVMFPNCEGRGAVEHKFRALNQRLQDDAFDLENMQIHTLYIYFLPKHCTKLDNRSRANFIFKRPFDGWPGRRRSRSRSPPRRARTPPHAPRAASRWRRSPSALSVHDSFHADGASSALFDVSAPPITAPLRRYSIETIDKRETLQNTKRQSSTLPPRSLDKVPLVNSTSIIPIASSSSATQNLAAKLVNPATRPIEHPFEADHSALPAMLQLSQEVDPHKDERAALRAQIEQGEVQRQLQRKRIRELQQEISAERDARRNAEARLEEERAKLEAERCKLQDVRRECSTPFVTPALLDAFENISGIARDMLQL